MKKLLAALFCILSLSVAQAEDVSNTTSGGGGTPGGTAGGSLTGSYPNPGLNLGGTNTGNLPAANGGYPVFSVKTYGATGNGTTDDTAAINLTIAALNAAGGGVLSFPPGNYYTASCAFTTITAPFLTDGAGRASFDGLQFGSAISCNSPTAYVFTTSAKVGRFQHIGCINTSSTTPTAGGCFLTNSSYLLQDISYEDISVSGFYDDIDQFVGSLWSLHASVISNPVRYGVYVQNTVNGDAGDWSITDNNFVAGNNTSAVTSAAIYQTSSGGGKISNNKVNASGSGKFVNGFLGNLSGSEQTLITHNDIENVLGAPIEVTVGWPYMVINDNYLLAPCSNPAIDLGSTSGVNGFIIAGNILETSCGSAVPYAIKTYGSSNGIIGYNQYHSGFTNPTFIQNQPVYDVSAGEPFIQNVFNVGSITNGNTTAILNFLSNYSSVQQTASIASDYSGSTYGPGLVYTAVRDLGGFGHVWKSHGGTTYMLLDTSNGTLTLTGEFVANPSGSTIASFRNGSVEKWHIDVNGQLQGLNGANISIGQQTEAQNSINVGVGTVTIPEVLSNGTKFTTSGCSVSATTGGASAGKYTSGTGGTCTVTITLKGASGVTAPNGWSCWANDETTPADKQQTTGSTATTVTISGPTASGDVVDFGCMGF